MLIGKVFAFPAVLVHLTVGRKGPVQGEKQEFGAKDSSFHILARRPVVNKLKIGNDIVAIVVPDERMLYGQEVLFLARRRNNRDYFTTIVGAGTVWDRCDWHGLHEGKKL